MMRKNCAPEKTLISIESLKIMISFQRLWDCGDSYLVNFMQSPPPLLSLIFFQYLKHAEISRNYATCFRRRSPPERYQTKYELRYYSKASSRPLRIFLAASFSILGESGPSWKSILYSFIDFFDLRRFSSQQRMTT